MINESEEGEAETGGGGQSGEATGDMLDQPGVIQVSPQDKEAIERVRDDPDQLFLFLTPPFLAQGSGFSWTPRGPGLLRLWKKWKSGRQLSSVTELRWLKQFNTIFKLWYKS